MNFNSADEILDFAILREQESYAFYMDMGRKMDNMVTRQLFEGFAQEELGHKRRLEEMKKTGVLKPAEGEIKTLNISDYVVDVELTPNLDYQEALIIAMKKEKSAFRLYMDLAGKAGDPELAAVFTGLAQEEARHKLRFEIEYDEHILTEN